ncbi:MAG: hypothetical protein KAU20_01760 [Nanoarchaeota archaeon]|nr:hypothetical protein [Nanoarchaeota archaeon]
MIELQNKTNVEAPNGEYPYGKTKNNTGTNNGTPVNEELVHDVMQFFEKLMAEGAVVANGIPDNEYDGFQLYEAFAKLARPCRIYKGLISQSGTGTPSITMLGIDDMPGTVLARTGVGQYTLTLTGEYLAAKTFYQISTGINSAIESFLRRVSDDVMQIDTHVANVNADSVLDNTPIEICIYD